MAITRFSALGFCAVVVLFVASECVAMAVDWSGHKLQQVTKLKDLPGSVQRALGVGVSGLQGIADVNGAYNSTDVVDTHLPMRRFAVAGVDGNSALVALEQGGRGWSVQVLLFSNTERTPTVERKWILFKVPNTLRALVDSLPTH